MGSCNPTAGRERTARLARRPSKTLATLHSHKESHQPFGRAGAAERAGTSAAQRHDAASKRTRICRNPISICRTGSSRRRRGGRKRLSALRPLFVWLSVRFHLFCPFPVITHACARRSLVFTERSRRPSFDGQRSRSN